jgi:hypothetical protein
MNGLYFLFPGDFYLLVLYKLLEIICVLIKFFNHFSWHWYHFFYFIMIDIILTKIKNMHLLLFLKFLQTHWTCYNSLILFLTWLNFNFSSNFRTFLFVISSFHLTLMRFCKFFSDILIYILIFFKIRIKLSLTNTRFSLVFLRHFIIFQIM